MSYAVRIRDTAERDLAEQQDWYEQQVTGLGEIFNAEVDRLIDRLAESPLIYPVIHRDVRRAVLRRFPHLLWFRVAATQVTVIACTHGRRDPARVRQRLR